MASKSNPTHWPESSCPGSALSGGTSAHGPGGAAHVPAKAKGQAAFMDLCAWTQRLWPQTEPLLSFGHWILPWEALPLGPEPQSPGSGHSGAGSHIYMHNSQGHCRATFSLSLSDTHTYFMWPYGVGGWLPSWAVVEFLPTVSPGLPAQEQGCSLWIPEKEAMQPSNRFDTSALSYSLVSVFVGLRSESLCCLTVNIFSKRKLCIRQRTFPLSLRKCRWCFMFLLGKLYYRNMIILY